MISLMSLFIGSRMAAVVAKQTVVTAGTRRLSTDSSRACRNVSASPSERTVQSHLHGLPEPDDPVNLPSRMSCHCSSQQVRADLFGQSGCTLGLRLFRNHVKWFQQPLVLLQPFPRATVEGWGVSEHRSLFCKHFFDGSSKFECSRHQAIHAIPPVRERKLTMHA